MSERAVPSMPHGAHEALWILIRAARRFAELRAAAGRASEQSSAETIIAGPDDCQAITEKLAEK
jgi:hypothetical protein